MAFHIDWPAKGRLIPDASNSVVVTVLVDSEVLATQVVARPSDVQSVSNVVFDHLPPTTLTITAEAKPAADGTGVSQAVGSTTALLQPGRQASASITLSSAIDHLELTSIGVLSKGETETVVVSAKNATGQVVLMSPSKLDWENSQPTVAQIEANGTSASVTGLEEGQTQFSATDVESGKSVSLTVNVTDQFSLDFPQTTVDVQGTEAWTYTFDATNHTNSDAVLQDLALEQYDRDGVYYQTQWDSNTGGFFPTEYTPLNQALPAHEGEHHTIVTDPVDQVSGRLAEMTIIYRGTFVSGSDGTLHHISKVITLSRDGTLPAPPNLETRGRSAVEPRGTSRRAG